MVLSYREVEADVPPFGRQKYQFTAGHAVRDAARFLVGLTEILPGVRLVLQLSFFLHNSNFFRQPSSLRVQRREQLERKTVFFVCEDRNFEGNFERRKTLEIDLVR